MKTKIIKILFLFCIFFPYFKSFAQDGKAIIDLGRDEKLQFSYYDKNHGLWAIVESGNYVAQVSNCKVHKYSPDLSKKEWTTEMKGIEPKALFDAKYPNYIYFRSADAPPRQLIPQKIRFYQLDQTGKLRIYEAQKEKEKLADDNIAIFTSMNHFCELWTKKKSNSPELLLVMRHNETLQKTVKTIKLPDIEAGKDYTFWHFSSVRDSLLTLVSSETDKKELKVTSKSRVLLIDMTTGEVIKQFYHTPTLETGDAIWLLTYRDKETQQSISYETIYHHMGLDSYIASRVNIKLANDGKSFHHYGVIFKKKQRKHYFVWTVLDFEGQQTAQSEYPVELPLDTHRMFNFSLEETDAQNIKLQLLIPSEKQSEIIAVLFDKDGKQLQDCKKESFQKYRFLQDAQTAVKSPSDIYTCFIKRGKRVTDYILEKNFNASYGMISDNGHHILLISMKKDAVLGLVYFKD